MWITTGQLCLCIDQPDLFLQQENNPLFKTCLTYHIFPAHLGWVYSHAGYPSYTLSGIFGTMFTSKILFLLETDLILLAQCDTLRRTFPLSPAYHYFFPFKFIKMKAFELNEGEGGINKLQTKDKKTFKIQTARTQHVSSRCTNAASRNGACPCRQLPQKGKKLPALGKTQTQLLFVWLVSPRKAFIFLSSHPAPRCLPRALHKAGWWRGEFSPHKMALGSPPGPAPHAAVGLWAQPLHTLK